MSTRQPDYDTKPDFGTLVEKHKQLSFKRMLDLVDAKLDDLNDYLLRPAPYDQSPGRSIPGCISCWFGPLPLTTARRTTEATNEDAAGHELLATLATPDKFFTPRNGNIETGRDSAFRAMSMSAYGFVNWGYKAQPGFTVPTSIVNVNGVGDILDAVGTNPAIGQNGGAMPLDFFGGTFSTLSTPQPNLPNISFEIEMYDKQRGRRLHDGRLPSEMFSGGRHGPRKLPSPLVFPQGTKVEPRLYLTELRMGSILDTDDAFNDASVKGWVCLVFKGIELLEIPNL